ncbi:hypothetical protein ADMFC3_27360 [Geovibrio sp. ADMFC3]|nr:hypothetical protein [Deferribacteraceae bacterium]
MDSINFDYVHDYVREQAVIVGSRQYIISEKRDDREIENPFSLKVTPEGPVIIINPVKEEAVRHDGSENKEMLKQDIVIEPASVTPSLNDTPLFSAVSLDSTAVYFAFASHFITPAGYDILASFIQSFTGKEKPELRVTGYTDCIGTQNQNDKLALKRAEAVAKHLRFFGFEAEPVGKGLCCYEETRALSRRAVVEIKKEVTNEQSSGCAESRSSE